MKDVEKKEKQVLKAAKSDPDSEYDLENIGYKTVDYPSGPVLAMNVNVDTTVLAMNVNFDTTFQRLNTTLYNHMA